MSEAPDFLRPDGSALSFDILGAITNLALSINGVAVLVNTDITVTGVTAAPSTNNTCLVNDASISSDFHVGENGSVITIDTVGSEISDRIGQFAAFKTGTGEIFYAFVKSATELSNVFRGYYIDDGGDGIERGALSDNDTLTLLNIGYVFVENNGSTTEVSYTTPVYSHNAPSSPSTGDYYYDLSSKLWKRYSGSVWEIINRVLIGQVVSDTTAVIGSRCLDFAKNFNDFNNVKLEKFSNEIVRSVDPYSRVSVYGNDIAIDNTKTDWNITTDLASLESLDILSKEKLEIKLYVL